MKYAPTVMRASKSVLCSTSASEKKKFKLRYVNQAYTQTKKEIKRSIYILLLLFRDIRLNSYSKSNCLSTASRNPACNGLKRTPATIRDKMLPVNI